MADTRKWSRRVAAWKASGLRSEAFCRGKAFTAGGLRYWAHKLRQQVPDASRKPVVRIGRVLRRPAAVEAGPRPMVQPGVAESPAGIIVELGAARVAIRPGFDRQTLAAVLEMLGRRGGAQ